MKHSRIKYSIPYFFLVIFLSMKIAGFHAISHADDKDYAVHCAICDHAITHNLIPAIAPEVHDFPIENTEGPFQKEICEGYDLLFCTKISTDRLFSRPPPRSL